MGVIYALDYYLSPGPTTEPTTVFFARGVGFHGIVDSMAQSGVIDNPVMFKAIAVATGSARNFKAGEYAIPAQATPTAIMKMLAAGKVVVHKVTIAEGLNVREITKILQNEPTLEGDVPAGIKEGSLLPETYHFMRGDKRADVVARMQDAMKTTLDSLWEKRKENPYITTREQALILASIVEKETGVVYERPRVASVFYNRLRLGMRLQTDPTVAYGIEQKLGAPMGRLLTSNDLQTPTPYNTYTIDGLPPTPIANPGKASIEAVMNPPETKDLYFVATGNGGHNFASSLEEHNRNVAQYRQAIRAAR
jgi:UPF0755 protein